MIQSKSYFRTSTFFVSDRPNLKHYTKSISNGLSIHVYANINIATVFLEFINFYILITGGINKTKYREEYENLKMRQDVLNTEIRDIQGEINSYVKEISDGERQISKIQQEEKKVIGQIQSLQDKLHSLEQHRAQYERECECTRQAQKETREKLHQTQDILLTVEIQMEKVL